MWKRHPLLIKLHLLQHRRNSSAAKGSWQHLLSGFATAKRKPTGYGIKCNFKTGWNPFLSEVGEMDVREFSDPAVMQGYKYTLKCCKSLEKKVQAVSAEFWRRFSESTDRQECDKQDSSDAPLLFLPLVQCCLISVIFHMSLGILK